jgi:AcrR family transcriptional regulator
MQDTPSTRDRILAEAGIALGDTGLPGLTIAAVAERAGVSSALVHYHFDTKGRLLVALAGILAAARAEWRVAALRGGRGLEALDGLWEALRVGAASGAERAYADLLLHARRDAAIATVLAEHRLLEHAAFAGRLPGLLREMGAGAPAGVDELAAALAALLDGLVLALLGAQDERSVRAAYDAFWLTLLAAGQRGH